jgi:hypothetical protein
MLSRLSSECPLLNMRDTCNLEPLHQVTLPYYYNESRDIEHLLDQSMQRQIFRPAKPEDMTAHKKVLLFEARPAGRLAWK